MRTIHLADIAMYHKQNKLSRSPVSVYLKNQVFGQDTFFKKIY